MLPPAANLGLETRTDRGNSTAGTARSALDKGESLLSSQGGVGRLAHAAQHVCRRVPPKHILNVLCLEPALDRQRTSTRKRSGSSQLGKHKGKHVLGVPVNTLADGEHVLEPSLLGSDTDEDRLLELERLARVRVHLGVELAHRVERTPQQRVVPVLLPRHTHKQLLLPVSTLAALVGSISNIVALLLFPLPPLRRQSKLRRITTRVFALLLLSLLLCREGQLRNWIRHRCFSR